MEMDQLYTELILEHNQDKRNKHELDAFTVSELLQMGQLLMVMWGIKLIE